MAITLREVELTSSLSGDYASFVALEGMYAAVGSHGFTRDSCSMNLHEVDAYAVDSKVLEVPPATSR